MRWERLPVVWRSGVQEPDKPPQGETPYTVHLPFVVNGDGKADGTESEGGADMGQSQAYIDPYMAQAIIDVEAPAAFGPDGKLIIRFEAHIFRQKLNNDKLFARNFQVADSEPWAKSQWCRVNENAPWWSIHTGNQSNEWQAYEVASRLNRRAALLSISMGLPQIMGFNYGLIGYDSPEAMFDAFCEGNGKGEIAQAIGLINYVMGNPALLRAVREKDFETIAYHYNGSGAVQTYAPLLRDAYRRRRG
jgi:hypothetical protein